MKLTNKGIWIAKKSVKNMKRSKIPMERNPTFDFGTGKKLNIPGEKTKKK